jgi:hypothetical protein
MTCSKPFQRVDLVGLLSNPELVDRLARLSARRWKPLKPRDERTVGVAPDGRRPFGVVRDAILQVLRDGGEELRSVEIHRRVEVVLGETVSYGAVKAYLWDASRREDGLIRSCLQRGFYDLRRSGGHGV